MLATAQGANPADPANRLDHVTGVTGFATAPDAPLHRVFGREIIDAADYAVTQAASAAEVVLPDSSIVSLGQNSLVRVGALDSGAAGPGATIAINGGSLRFDVRRPQGGTANYRFSTPTSQIAVRGTVGLISFINGTTTVACLVCQADSVSIVAGGQTFALANGHFITIGADGSVASGAVTDTLLQTFQANYVSTVIGAGVVADTIVIEAAHAAAALPLAAAGIAAAAAIEVTDSAQKAVNPQAAVLPTNAPPATPTSSPTPVPTSTPTTAPTTAPTPAPTNTPTAAPTSTPTAAPTNAPTAAPTATPTANANVGIESKKRAAAPASQPTPNAAVPPSVPESPRGHLR